MKRTGVDNFKDSVPEGLFYVKDQGRSGEKWLKNKAIPRGTAF